ncbi:MAG: PspA/IM30 family protein [Candidatus Obscuribacterales bacterium]|nr:PspA/IM30 family protein [Candidatus Obscuribacterales bacterium]
MSEQPIDKDGPLEVRVSKLLNMPADIVFSVLSKIPMLWWRLPSFGNFSGIHRNIAEDRDLVFEAKLGGRLYERCYLGDDEGTLFATVVSLRRPELLVLEGSFGMGSAGLPFGVLTLSLAATGNTTEVSITHRALKCPSDEIKMQLLVLWTDFLYRLESFVTATVAPVSLSTVQTVAEESDDLSRDAELLLDTVYQELQDNLIQVRQVVAQAVATDKQLEQQLQKNKDQASTWHNRAMTAQQQGEEVLERQSLQREQQFSEIAEELSRQLIEQRASTDKLREQLTNLEGEVQKAFTKKQILLARDKAERATRRAQEILSRVNPDNALMAFETVEKKILEREAQTKNSE